MAACSRSRAAHTTSETSAATTIADLPEELLQAVLARCLLGEVDLQHRLQAVALVSRRFAALVWACVPDLKLKVEANGLQSLPALRLLAGWLRRSGQHLCQLTLRLHGNDELAEEDASTLAAAATACFEALGQAGGPEPAASRPMMLHSLELSGHPLSLPAGLRLPPSITRLDLYIEQCHPPPSLAALTRLQHLSLSPGSAEGIAMLDGALPQLQQLTCLVLSCEMRAQPTSLGSLASLQRCFLEHTDGAEPLPGGPWMASLRWLGAPLDTLTNSVAVLRGATALQLLYAGQPLREFDWTLPAVDSFFDWLAAHPPLRQFCFEDNSAVVDEWIFGSLTFGDRLEELEQRRPGLADESSEPGGARATFWNAVIMK